MADLYLIIVILLFGLAISDLIVGVSNDAVNFLNSAIGSKVASRKVIMIVASLGIFAGATFSSGMMEVARKGIFNPEFFVFAEVMVIFLAVMLTDIILLDFFNTFGLPTSTTVSIVFELLGAAVAVSILKIMAAGEGLASLGDHINSSSALAIISGIFISIGIAFVVGAIVQYLSRLLFSFHYEKRLQAIGPVWAGLALTLLTYFLLLKGLKGASFVSDDFLQWMAANTWLILGAALLFWTSLMQILLSLFQVNILKIIVLFGTFSLAMAFAGNDLVNFIGVPIAGFESFLAWSGSGTAAESFPMEALNNPVRTKTYLLLLAGLIMILTLWFSKKARSVTETEVNLGRQDEGSERFSPNLLSRWIVRYSFEAGKRIQKLLPNSWIEKAENNFEPVDQKKENGKDFDPPAFDLVRASVNLTVASMLIAFATSLKLPLSTTYVSFMVAMGTSLADRAWGRDSAVYRIAGVLNVIAGWFFTAVIAFTASAAFAFLIYKFGMWAVVGLVLMAAFLIFRTFLLHRQREKEKAGEEAFERQTDFIPSDSILRETAGNVAATLNSVQSAFRLTLEGLLKEDPIRLKKAKKKVKGLRRSNKELKKKLYSAIRRIEEHGTEGSRIFLLVYDLEQDILQSITFIFEACLEHVENVHKPLDEAQGKALDEMAGAVVDYLQRIGQMMEQYDFSALPAILEEKSVLFIQLEKLLSRQMLGVKKEKYSRRNTMLFFSLLLETKDLIAVAARFGKLYDRIRQYAPEKPVVLLAGERNGNVPASERG